MRRLAGPPTRPSTAIVCSRSATTSVANPRVVEIGGVPAAPRPTDALYGAGQAFTSGVPGTPRGSLWVTGGLPRRGALCRGRLHRSFTSQSKQSKGFETCVARADPTENEDVVVWHSKPPFWPIGNPAVFGLTHNPRIQDFAIMPVKRVRVLLGLDGSFTGNSAIDIPPPSREVHQSVLLRVVLWSGSSVSNRVRVHKSIA